MLHFACNKNAFLGKNVVCINVGIRHFKKCLEGRKMQKRQDHWRKQNNSHADTGAVTLMLNSTLSDDSVS
jgi:predicted transposase YbfD/YdcC